MALARVEPPSTVVRTPVRVFLKRLVLLVRRQNFQTLHQRQASIDHDRKLTEEDRDLLGLDLARAEGRHGKLFAFFPDGRGVNTLLAQLSG